MRLTVLPLEESRLRLHLNVERLNQEQPVRSHIRVGADGRIKTVTTRPKVLCDGAKTTGVLLLQRARKQAIHLLASQLHSELFTSSDGENLPDVPPIEVNGRELSEKRGLTDRALRNHLAQLTQVGIIVKRKFRGTRASFHVWLDPELIWGIPPKAAATAEEPIPCITYKASIPIPKSKNLPDTKVLEPLETPEREITDVDKFVTESCAGFETRNPLQETEARNCKVFKQKKNGAKGGAPISGSCKTEPADTAVQDPVLLKKMIYVLEFWEAAKVLVYPNGKWTDEQERLAKNSIWTNVYRGFHNYEKYDWHSIQLGLLQRLQLAHNHFQLHPSRYAPFPYSQYKPSSGYFDAANARGFAGTAAWLKTVKKRKQSLKVDRTLRAAIMEINQHKALAKTPGIKLKANERVRTYSLSQLIKYHEGCLIRLGNAKALSRFYANLANKVPKTPFKAISPR